jgi:hypothetical protein
MGGARLGSALRRLSPRLSLLPAHMSCRQGLTNACGIDIELNCGLAPREHVALGKGGYASALLGFEPKDGFS